MGKQVNRKELAVILGKSIRTINLWQTEGLPVISVNKRGQGNKYDTEKVINWLIARELAKATGGDKEAIDYYAERARLTKAQADRTELKNSEDRGKLLPVEAVEASWSKHIMAAKSKLLGLPTKIAPMILGCSDLAIIKHTLQAEVKQALRELSETS